MVMTVNEYVESCGERCPVCESEKIRGQEMDPVESYQIIRDVSCDDCTAAWTEKYVLESYELESFES